jgi:hypothetical protein
MVAFISLTVTILGAGVACAGEYAPAHVEALERWGGGLLLGGLALLGAALGSAMSIVH